MSQRTSPRTSAVHPVCIGVHRACPSPPYTPLCVTRTHGLHGPCACHIKIAQGARRAARARKKCGAWVQADQRPPLIVSLRS